MAIGLEDLPGAGMLVNYEDAFGETIPAPLAVLTAEQEDQVYRMAEKAIERGEPLTEEEVNRALGLDLPEGAWY